MNADRPSHRPPPATAPSNPPLIQPLLVRRVVRQFALDVNGPHGPLHWGRVLQNGRGLAQREGLASQLAALFALLHDSQRQSEHHDPAHGERAAAFARQLWDDGWLTIDAHQLALLEYACLWHSASRMDGDPIVRICWDADRLDLGRVGLTPRKEWLCSEAARDEALFNWASAQGLSKAVPEVITEEWGLQVAAGHIVDSFSAGQE